jgi:hypothetical protein
MQQRQTSIEFDAPRFAGADYQPERDNARLGAQIQRVYDLMRDGAWRTLSEIARLTGAPEASASAQLRNLRKPDGGAHVVNRRYVGDGLYEYQIQRKTQ